MENKMEIFKNEEFDGVRIIEEHGKYLFCGSDVAKALGYTNPNIYEGAYHNGKRKTVSDS